MKTSPLKWLVSRPYYAHPLLFCLGMVLCMLMVYPFGTPMPQVHDEFSYLLMADTFASGQLANPSHPLAKYFESFHILVDPVYQSKYFPLQGIYLAIGQLIGHPILGIWISVGLMGNVFYYAAQALVDRRLAWLAALCLMIHFGVLNNWGYIFWGGTPFAIAGTMVLGGTLHHWRSPARKHGLMAGIGLASIILSRPYEGFFFCLPLAFFTLYLLKLHPLRKLATALVLPQAVLLVIGLGLLGMYNHAITGSLTKFPHSLFHETYFPDTSRFLWEEAKESPPIDRNPQFDQYAQNSERNRPENFTEYITKMLRTAANWISDYFPWFVGVGFVLVLLAYQQIPKPLLFLLFGLTAARFVALPLSASVRHSHYTAAWTALALIILALGLQVAVRRFSLKHSYLMVGLILFLQGISYSGAYFTPWNPGLKKYTTLSERNFGKFRHRIYSKLLNDYMYDQVVLVRYNKGHNLHNEWVYNSANIDDQRVIWARWRGDQTLDDFREYYPEHKIWTLDVPDQRGMVSLQPIEEPSGEKSTKDQPSGE